jgi:hypothetical protein
VLVSHGGRSGPVFQAVHQLRERGACSGRPASLLNP